MYRIAYVSVAAAEMSWSVMDAIAAASRANNRRDEITGLLLHDGRRFMQVVEGKRDQVEAAFARILDDPRHQSVRLVSAEPISRRAFAQWDLACAEVSTGEDRASFAGRLARIAANVHDPALKTGLMDFAEDRPVSRASSPAAARSAR